MLQWFSTVLLLPHIGKVIFALYRHQVATERHRNRSEIEILTFERSDLMPDTLFNMVKNRQVRPNTPFLWTYARDETYGMTTDWIKGRSNPGHVLQNVRNDIIADQDRFQEIYSPEV